MNRKDYETEKDKIIEKLTLGGGEEAKRSMKALRCSREGGGNCGTLRTISTQRLPKVATSKCLDPTLLSLESGGDVEETATPRPLQERLRERIG
jgi:hypothetical protein